MSAVKLDPALCRQLATALRSPGDLLIARHTFADQLTAAADLAERKTLTEEQVHEVVKGAVADRLKMFSADAVERASEAIADRIAKELAGAAVGLSAQDREALGVAASIIRGHIERAPTKMTAALSSEALAVLDRLLEGTP